MFVQVVSPLALALLALPNAVQGLPSWLSGSRSFHADSIKPVARAANVARAPTSTSSAIKFQYTPPPHAKRAPVAAAWYAGWHGGEYDFPPEEVSYDKYTTIVYSFAETQPDPGNLTVSATDDPILRKVVEYAHEVGTNVTISVGGWTGSEYYSSAVGSQTNRTKFVNALLKIVDTYKLDGVDFDWEYPGNQGIGCNLVSVNDTANFLLFLKDLRASKLPKTATLSAATAINPFIGPDGTPLKDVSEFAKYLDYIEIMNYDIWGPWSETAGPNAPLNDTCVAKPSAQAGGSAVSAIKSWTGAGFPPDQIVLGVASYGHAFNVTPSDALQHVNVTEKVKGKDGKYEEQTVTKLGKDLNSSYPLFNATGIPVGDVWDGAPGIDQCGNLEAQGGVFDFWGLITTGFLTQNGTAAPGISYLYDNCTQTPSVYNATSQILVEYDDATSFLAKGKYIAAEGLRGFAIWEAGGDYNDILLDAIREGAGWPALECDTNPFTTSRVYPSTTYTTSTPTPTPTWTHPKATSSHHPATYTTSRHDNWIE